MSSSLNHSNPQPVLFELPLARRRNLQYSIDPVKGGLRKLHIRRLFDLLHLSLLRQDLSRAHKIWRILIRSREVDFAQLWHLGLRLLLPSSTDLTGDEDERLSGLETSLSYLKACQNLDLKESVTVLSEYICLLVSLGRHRDGLNELKLYLSTLPYSEHAGLHEYAGMLALFLAQPPLGDRDEENLTSTVTDHIRTLSASPYFGRARSYFERAQLLDPESLPAAGYLALMSSVEGCHELDAD